MVVQALHGLKHLDSYLDDIFLAEMSDIECSNSMFKFKPICKRLGAPITDIPALNAGVCIHQQCATNFKKLIV